MPSAFRSIFKTNGVPALATMFWEPVVYYPQAGGTLPMQAKVERRQLELLISGEVVMAAYVITIEEDAENGIQSKDVDRGGDSIDVLENEGDSAYTRVTVLEKISEANGEIVLAAK